MGCLHRRQQLLALWAASTAAFLILAIFKQRRAVSWPRRFALALTLAGAPYLAWTMLRITLVGYDTLTRRQRWLVVGVVAAMVLLGFILGRLNPYFLTCDDFTISGNFPPPGCTPGSATFR